MRTLTKVAIGTLAAPAVALALAAPAFADDGTTATVVAAGSLPGVGAAARTLVAIVALALGVVLLAKGLTRARHSRWRRRWMVRRAETVFVSSVRRPAGALSGRSIARPPAGIVGGTVARSSTRL